MANCAARRATCISPRSGRSRKSFAKARRWPAVSSRADRKAGGKCRSSPSCRSKSLTPPGHSTAAKRRRPSSDEKQCHATPRCGPFCSAPLLAQERSARPAPPPATRSVRDTQPGPKTVGDYSSDIVVVRDAQEQALEQVRSLQERVEDPRAQAALESAVKEMEHSLAMLEEAKQSPEKLAAALAAQQQASPQQNAEQREQLQVLNRLKELAQRQQDLNERLKELQTALQEAKTED